MGLHWEKVCIAEPKHEFSGGQVYRSRVPGGWLLAMFWHSTGYAGGPSMCFYPDPNHEWNGDSLEVETSKPSFAGIR
jgi:hypothetical protein